MRLILLLSSLIFPFSALALKYDEKPSAGSFCYQQGFHKRALSAQGISVIPRQRKIIRELLDRNPDYYKKFQDRVKTRDFCNEYARTFGIHYFDYTRSIPDAQEQYSKFINQLKETQSKKEEAERQKKAEKVKLDNDRAMAPKKVEEFKALATTKRSEIQKTEQKIRQLKDKMHEVEKAGKKPFKYFYQMYKSLGDGLYVCRLGTTGETFVLRDGSRLITNPRAGEFYGYLTRSGTMPLSKNGFPIEVAIFDLADEGTKPYKNWVENYAPQYDRHYEDWDREEKKLKTLIKERNDAEQKQKYYSKLISKE